MGKGVFKRSAVFLIILLMVMNSVTTTKPVSKTRDFFSSSFVQYWYAEDWDELRWEREMEMLKEAGVGEIILQSIADTEDKYTVYPSLMPDYTHNDRDMVGTALKAADKVGMKVRMGLGFSDVWWDKGASSLEWLNQEAEENIKIIREVVSLYGHHTSLAGWFIPHEFSQITARTKKQQSNLNLFLKKITGEIRRFSREDIMISPFYSSSYSWLVPMAQWSNMVVNILEDSGVDILALQDGVGAAHIDLSQLDKLFRYTKTSTDMLGIKLYGNIETFTSTDSGNVPASYDRIFRQFSIERSYVDGFIAFSINHFQNKNVDKQRDYYYYYLDYYVSNK